jgi:hypothetical protein
MWRRRLFASTYHGVDDSSTGIAMCHITVFIQGWPMSAIDAVDGSSTGIANDRLWHLADIPAYPDLCLLSGVKRTL